MTDDVFAFGLTSECGAAEGWRRAPRGLPMKQHQGSGFAVAGLACLLAHFGGWLGFAAALLSAAAFLRTRQWLRGPYDVPAPGMDKAQAERVGREMGAKLAEQLVVVLNAARSGATREKGH